MIRVNGDVKPFAYEQVDGSHQQQRTIIQRNSQGHIQQVQLIRADQISADGHIVEREDSGGTLSSSSVIPMETMNSNGHEPVTHTIQLRAAPTQLVEILLDQNGTIHHSPHVGSIQTLQLHPSSLSHENNQIVVLSHSVNGLGSGETHHLTADANGMVTMSLPINGLSDSHHEILSQHDSIISDGKIIVTTSDVPKMISQIKNEQAHSDAMLMSSEHKSDQNTTTYIRLAPSHAREIEMTEHEFSNSFSHDSNNEKSSVITSMVTVNSVEQNFQEEANAQSVPPRPQTNGKVVSKKAAPASKNQSHRDEALSDSDYDENGSLITKRKCVVCLRIRKFTQDVYDSQNQLMHHIEPLVSHLKITVKKQIDSQGPPEGMCMECMDHLQRWFIFHGAIARRHETADNQDISKVTSDAVLFEAFEARVYRNYKKMGKVKEVFQAATHAHYARRHLTEKDWDYFCDHLFHSNSVKSEKSKELERFLTSREKLSHLFCIKCEILIPNGKKGYTMHMQTYHNEHPILYPCDICGQTFPEKDMTASTEDYYPHWISHFYFNQCDDCSKRFPTKRALGQHRHAVHKNRQVKCDKCGKVLANKMSLDLHLLRHLPENEKKKYMIKCQTCKKKIAQWNLKSHLATHNDDRPWKCDRCDATFKMKGALVSHRDVVHYNLKNHVCPICNEAFKSASSLRGHVRRHEGRKDYKCEVCLKEYYTYSALKGHKVVHQTARDFICEICGKAFKKKKALEEHGTIHTGEKPHQCPICGREIRVKSNLYKHMKIHKKNDNGLPKPPDASVSKKSRKKKIPKSNPNDTPSSQNSPAILHPSGGVIVRGNTAMSDNIMTEGNRANQATTTIVDIHMESPHTTKSVDSNLPVTLMDTENHQQKQEIIFEAAQANYMSTGDESVTSYQSNSQGDIVHTITLPQQHDEILNMPMQNGQYRTEFYTAPQYFSALDPLQN